MVENIFIHPSSTIDDGATIGKDTKIWHYCHIMPRAYIGENCIIGQNVFIANNVRIGNGVKIQNNVSIYEGVTLDDDVFVGPSVVFTNVKNPRSSIDRKSEYRKTNIEKGATIGANATIVCGISIGMYAFIGAGSVVTKNVLPYEMVVGNPSRHFGWMSKAGIQLNFDNNGVAFCFASKEKYLLSNNMVHQI